ncbi:L-gulonate 5-dehydrogenase [Moryella indoligenes]|uniref:L-gulonate 5-dehydrogenase n=1 Tax=Moryella indoligenes TaxID=371674 RepID=A0AAE3V999_9FIRM|nr:alcohol dehydrogenase catalytic domain-containing protein [Moryella indoligenes]MDQ0152129.1 L-gulonate 5-dehydrogenase [Moryella indoligenes]
MKAVRIMRPGELRVVDETKPVLDGENNVLIRMTAAGICGSDVGIYHGTNAAATYPRIIGHEIVGMVEETGAGVTAVHKGDRVIVDQVTACGHCYACRKGRPNVCGNLKVRGVHIDGGYRQWIAVPEDKCYLLPDSISDTDAIMIEPTTIAIQSCSRAELSEEDTLLLIGVGALGSSILKIARLHCKNIIVADVVEEKLDEALERGARWKVNIAREDLEAKVREYTDGYGATVTIDAACTKDSLMNALKCTGNAGRVVTMGFSVADTVVNQFVITSKELDVRGSRLQNRKFGEAIELLKSGQIDLNGAVSHTFKLTDAQKAFDFIDSRDPSIRKIALTFEDLD